MAKDEGKLDVLHLDMDCFFVAVEVKDDPSLAGLPVAVGGNTDRGVVASASYEARAFGVHAAMSTAVAKRQCADLVIISPHFERYTQMNRELLRIIEQVTPDYEPIAFDEAFIDVAGAHRLFGTSEEIARRLHAQVHDELGLSCSVGVARNKLLAKLGSKAAKPTVQMSQGPPRRALVMPGEGVTVIDTDREYQFLHSHGLRALPGIGPKTAERMRALGLNTIADAVEVGRARLIAHFGASLGSQIDDLVHGIDHRRVHRSREARSIGTETTFDRDIFDPDHLRSQIFQFSQRVIARASAQGLVARTVSLKVRYSDLTLISRANTPDAPPRSGEEVARLALGLLDHISIERGIRLLGVHLSNFVGAETAPGEQLSLFDGGEADQEETPQTRRLDAARMEIARRFGEGALDHASLVAPQRAISRNDIERPH